MMAGLLVAGGVLVVFGLAYNRLMEYLHTRRAGDFMAGWVAIGILVILAVLLFGLWGQTFTAQMWVALFLYHATCAGVPMAWGSWRRRVG